ncbi:MAG: hypothetical protein LBC75_06260 [Fibromonadaceae bacterium]|jgi:hypothetical protein|nr:hypothetical protein [Fibromonadaceae bacterium]
MFTFKKFALTGAVAVALSMVSCTDIEDPVDEEDVDLIKKSFTLSKADASYGDLDAAKTYKQAEATTKAADIDIVAYYTSEAGNKVFNPCGIAYTPIATECGVPELYPIPQKYQAALKSATKRSEIADFLKAFADDEITGGNAGSGVNGGDANEVWDIDISKDKAFLVMSTDVKYFIVIMTATGAETVSLQFSSNGFEK